MAADEDAKHWQAQIVKSPEKVKTALKDLEQQLDREKAEFNSQEKYVVLSATVFEDSHLIFSFFRKYNMLDLRMQAIQKIETDLEKCNHILSRHLVEFNGSLL